MAAEREKQKNRLSERRRSSRFGLSLPMKIVKLRDKPVDVRGATRDLSSTGAYFVVDGQVEQGSKIEFWVTLLKGDGDDFEHDVRLLCRGRVVRLEAAGKEGAVGVAATIDRYQFLREARN